MNGPMAPGYRLGEEERARVRDCLAKAGVSLPARDFYLFVLDIEASIGHFPAAPERSFREAHEALRTLWQCSREHSPLVDKLLALLRALPKEAIEDMSRRARRVIPALFPGETIEDTVFDPPERLAAGFLNWTATSEEKKLVTALRVLTSDGGRIIIGRSRGSGKRSRPRLEPTIPCRRIPRRRRATRCGGIGGRWKRKRREHGRSLRRLYAQIVGGFSVSTQAATDFIAVGSTAPARRPAKRGKTAAPRVHCSSRPPTELRRQRFRIGAGLAPASDLGMP